MTPGVPGVILVSRWKNYFFFAGDLEAGFFVAGAAAGFAAGFFVAAKDCSSDYRSVASMGCAVPGTHGLRTGPGPTRFASSM